VKMENRLQPYFQLPPSSFYAPPQQGGSIKRWCPLSRDGGITGCAACHSLQWQYSLDV